MLARAPGQLGTGRGPARKIEWRAGAAICIMCVCMHFYTRQRACPQASTNGLSRCSRLISSGHVSAASGGPAPGASRTAGKEAWEGEHLAPARGACAWESTCSTWRWVFFPFVPARDVVVRRGACGCRVRSSPLGHAHLGHRPARQRLVPLVLGLFFFFWFGPSLGRSPLHVLYSTASPENHGPSVCNARQAPLVADLSRASSQRGVRCLAHLRSKKVYLGSLGPVGRNRRLSDLDAATRSPMRCLILLLLRGASRAPGTGNHTLDRLGDPLSKALRDRLRG